MFRKQLATVVAGLLAISFATACGAPSGGDSWSPLRLAGLEEVESYNGVLSMRDVADGVLSDDGRTLTVEFFAGGAEAENQINAGIAQLNADLTGAGSPDGRSVLFLRMNGGPGEPVPEGPGDPPDSAKPSADGCEITVDKKLLSRLGKGEVFDPAKHYPGYDERSNRLIPLAHRRSRPRSRAGAECVSPPTAR